MKVDGKGELTRLARHLERLASLPSDDVYARLAAYGFARRYVGDRDVLDIGWEEAGYGTHLLYESARSVVGLSRSADAAEAVSALYPASNASYREATLPDLPYPDESFDVAIAFGVLERSDDPEVLVREARRILRPGGRFLVATPDKQTNSIDRNRRALPGEMYVSELRELLERNFGQVELYRHGVVSGGLVYREDDPSDPHVEGARLSAPAPAPRPELPPTSSVMAVCGVAPGDAGGDAGSGAGRSYLLLDRDRRLIEEREELSEDVALLREEIRLMQETEALAFREAHHRARVNDRAQRQYIAKLENRLQAIEGSRVWRIFEPYRRLRTRLAGQVEEGGGHGPTQK